MAIRQASSYILKNGDREGEEEEITGRSCDSVTVILIMETLVLMMIVVLTIMLIIMTIIMCAGYPESARCGGCSEGRRRRSDR